MIEKSPPNELEARVPELPLAVYGSISRFLSTRQKIEVREVPGKHCPTYLHVASPSDVMNLCVAGGKAIADAVKLACLHKNKEYFWALAEGSHWLLDLLNQKIFSTSTESTFHPLQTDH